MKSVRVHWLTMKALVLFVLIDIGFHCVGFDAVYQRIVRRAARRNSAPADAADTERAQTTLHAVLQATRWYYRSRLDCLPKALTLYTLLRDQAIAADLCLGVKRFPFAGHAWVEVNGLVIDNKPKQVRRYTLIARA
jgi:Transglutaminase-like superfamily